MKADVKSSGIAAPVAQPRHPGELGTSLAPRFSADLLFGANNFMLLLERVHEIGDATVTRFGDHIDGRDYKAIAFEIETAILANLLGSGKAIREGFLRALTDYLSCCEDGTYPSEGWNPARTLATTSLAYATEGEAA